MQEVMEEQLDFKKFKVSEAPDDAYYVPDFITAEEEKELLKQVYQAPKPKWNQLSNRRLQNWGGLPHSKGMIADQIPNWLNIHLLKLHKMKIFEEKKPNHVLVNEYLPGQGIMPHLDGPLFYPTIATISLGSYTVLDFYALRNAEEENKVGTETSLKDRYIGSFLLEPRSLVCFKNDMYHSNMHGIEETFQDELNAKQILNKDSTPFYCIDTSYCLKRSTRVSLTIRNFPKILNVKLKLGVR